MWILGCLLYKIGNLKNRLINRYWLKKMPHGANCYLGGGGEYSRNIFLGNNVFIGEKAKFLSANAKIIIGNDVMIASNCTIITGNHRINVVGKKLNEVKENEKESKDDQDVVIEDDVWIGYGVTILKGVTIGHGSVIGACSVVTKSIPPYTIYTGSPNLKIRQRFTTEEILRHEELLEKRNKLI